MTSDYSKVLESLKNSLIDKNSITVDDINACIEKINIIIKNDLFMPEISLKELDEGIKIRLRKDIEMLYDIKMDDCTILTGEEQRTKDSEWWNKKKNSLDSEFSYWKHYLQTLSKLPPKVIRTIDTDTDMIMNNLFDPAAESQSESRYGMVMGHVQSGKTSNYAGLICKALDAGYKFIVIIAGIHDNLRNQTQKRIANIFKNINRSKQPFILTTDDNDFQKSSPQKFSTLNFDNTASPVFIVIKKNKTVLDAVLKWASQDNRVPMLVIDDEADNATINTKEEDDPTAINLRIRRLLKKFNKFSYVAYTATPFANIFINDDAGNNEDGPDLFPKDFIIVLKAPSNYIGASKLFLEENIDSHNKNLLNINEIESIEDTSEYYAIKGYEDNCKFEIPRNHKKDFQPQALPSSLLLAIRLFFINIAIRNIRHQDTEHNSMLIHASRFTGVHSAIAHLVEQYVSEMRKEICLYGQFNNSESSILNNMKSDFYEYYNNINLEWSDILLELNKIYDKVDVREAHCNSKQRIEYSEEHQTNIIAVGGNSLSRGFTLEGLSVSYFLRNAGAADTLMQMGRWFGYRKDYEDICKVFMPEDIIAKFEYVADMSNELYDLVDDMNKYQKTPKEFGLSVKIHPENFLITARNKMKSAQQFNVQIGLDGLTKEASRISRNDKIVEQNLNALKDFILEIDSKYKRIERDIKGTKLLWLDLPSEQIYKFLDNCHFISGYEHFPIDDIKQYIEKYSNDLWRVALVGTENAKINYKIEDICVGTQLRSVYEDIEKNAYVLGAHRQMTSGIAEKWGLTSEEFDNLKINIDGKITRKDIRRQLPGPLLILGIISPNNKENDFTHKYFPSLSCTFPSLTGERQPKTITRMVNSVGIKQLQLLEQKRIEEEEETDDE